MSTTTYTDMRSPASLVSSLSRNEHLSQGRDSIAASEAEQDPDDIAFVNAKVEAALTKTAKLYSEARWTS